MNIQQEVNKNYEVFKKLLPKIINTYENKYALMKNEKIIEYFETAGDAILTGNLIYKNRLFSVQKVTNTPIFILNQ